MIGILMSLTGCHLLEGKPPRTGGANVASSTPVPGDAGKIDQAPSSEVAKATGTAAAAPSQAVTKSEVHYGDGRFLRPTAAARASEIAPLGDIELNFAEADVREVTRTILGELLGVNYIVDPQIQGSVTLQTNEPLPKSALVSTLDTALRASGAAITRNGDLYQVVPVAEASRRAATLSIDSDALRLKPGHSVQAVTLDYLPASEMAKILGPLAPAGAILRSDDARNILFLGGGKSELETLLETVEIFDVDWMEGMSFGYFPIRYANVDTLTDELNGILEAQQGEAASRLVRLVPIGRLNSLLVITPQADYLDQAQEWITRLDRASDDGQPRLYVYQVKNRRAADLADLLTSIFGGENGTPSGFTPLVEEADVRPDVETVELRTLSGQVGSGLATPYDPATAPSGGVSATGSDHRIRVMADEGNNALVILATLAEFRTVLVALEKLDLLPLQVLVEATIAEVTLTDELAYGVEWFLQSGSSGATFSTQETGAVSSAFPGFSYLLSATDYRVVLNALSAVTDVKVVSSPKLMVLDNKTAALQVGDQVPISTQSSVSVSDPDAPIVNSIQYFDTGVILNVTPHVNTGGLVSMDIEQEVSDAIATTTSGIDSPTIQQRKISSSVAIQSGETIVLGGLIRERRTDSNTGIPILSNIPVLGHLFGTTSNNALRTELLILITPRVAESHEDARQITNDLRRQLRGLAPQS